MRGKKITVSANFFFFDGLYFQENFNIKKQGLYTIFTCILKTSSLVQKSRKV